MKLIDIDVLTQYPCLPMKNCGLILRLFMRRNDYQAKFESTSAVDEAGPDKQIESNKSVTSDKNRISHPIEPVCSIP